MARAVRAIVAAGPDAVQLAPGQAPLLQDVPGKTKPALVLRTDVTNVYGRDDCRAGPFVQLLAGAIERALRLDAACVVANLFLRPGRARACTAQCVDNVGRLRAACDRYGMPLMVEPIAMKPVAARRRSASTAMPNASCALVRQAVELGADVIKADPTDDLADFARVVDGRRGPAGARARRRQGVAKTRSSRARTRSCRRARAASSTAGTSSSIRAPTAHDARVHGDRPRRRDGATRRLRSLRAR